MVKLVSSLKFWFPIVPVNTGILFLFKTVTFTGTLAVNSPSLTLTSKL